MTHVLYPIFQEKSTENGLRYVRDLQVKIIDGDNVNQAKYHKWVRHIFKNTHGTCFMSNFLRESIGNGLRYVRGLQVMPIDVDNVNQAKYHKWVLHILKNMHGTFFIPNFSREVDY